MALRHCRARGRWEDDGVDDGMDTNKRTRKLAKERRNEGRGRNGDDGWEVRRRYATGARVLGRKAVGASHPVFLLSTSPHSTRYSTQLLHSLTGMCINFLMCFVFVLTYSVPSRSNVSSSRQNTPGKTGSEKGASGASDIHTPLYHLTPATQSSVRIQSSPPSCFDNPHHTTKTVTAQTHSPSATPTGMLSNPFYFRVG